MIAQRRPSGASSWAFLGVAVRGAASGMQSLRSRRSGRTTTLRRPSGFVIPVLVVRRVDKELGQPDAKRALAAPACPCGHDRPTPPSGSVILGISRPGRRSNPGSGARWMPGSSPSLSALTRCLPVTPRMPGIRRSMRSWESVPPCRNRRQGLPRSHGPAEERVSGPTVNFQLNRPRCLTISLEGSTPIPQPNATAAGQARPTEPWKPTQAIEECSSAMRTA
jgi:hypothetical protein